MQILGEAKTCCLKVASPSWQGVFGVLVQAALGEEFFGGGPDLFLVGFDNLLLRFFFYHLVNSAGFFVFFFGGGGG